MANFVRKTISMDKKLSKDLMELEAKLITTTHHEWSNSKVIASLIDYAVNHGADAKTIARIYDKK